MTKRPTYVLKDFPEDYIPIDKKTTTHHHYIWIQNRSCPHISTPYQSESIRVHRTLVELKSKIVLNPILAKS